MRNLNSDGKTCSRPTPAPRPRRHGALAFSSMCSPLQKKFVTSSCYKIEIKLLRYQNGEAKGGQKLCSRARRSQSAPVSRKNCESGTPSPRVTDP